MLSIIVTWKDRKELRETIDSLLETTSGINGELIIVDFDGEKDLIKQLVPQDNENVSVVHVLDQPMFNKAASNNIGAAHAHYDYLFFCDCDIVVELDSVKKLLSMVSADPKHFGTFSGVKETTVNSIQNSHVISFGYELVIKTQDGRVLNIVDSEEDANRGTRMAPGLLLTSKSNFEAVNGYNSTLIGWGWEDQDMISRLTLGAGLVRKQYGEALHISHNDEERTKHYPVSNRWESRDQMFRQALANYDANNFSGTYCDDITRYQFE